MAWWNGRSQKPQPREVDGVTLVDEHVLLIRRPAPKPA